jgi:NADH-quinone oxidoreductase subunit C
MAWRDAVAAVSERFADLGLAPRPLITYASGPSEQQVLAVPPTRLVELARFLKTDPRCKFEQLSDVTCVDYLNHPDPPSDERFGVTYSLLSLTHNHRLWLKVFVSDPSPTVPTLTGVWRGAEWTEREVYDLFGILFSGHPDLRRILCPDWFTEHPLRKDYPLRGKGEREKFDVLTRDSA